MKLLTSTVAVFAFITLTLQDEFILSLGKMESDDDFFLKMTKKSPKFDKPTRFVMEFDIDFGNRTFSFINFTTPFTTLNLLTSSEGIVYDHRVEEKFTLDNFKEYQIDATAYVRSI